MNLFEVNENIDYILQKMDEAQTEEEEQLYRDTLESLEFELEEQLENIAKSIKNLEADKKAYHDQANFFLEKEDRTDKKIARRKELAKAVMEHRGAQKIKTSTFDLRIQANGGKRGIEYFAKIEDLPEELIESKMIYTVRDEKVRELLDSGVTEYKGKPLSYMFKYREKGTHLRIT